MTGTPFAHYRVGLTQGPRWRSSDGSTGGIIGPLWPQEVVVSRQKRWQFAIRALRASPALACLVTFRHQAGS